ncbi:MAG TPA: CADD family putative folate metabolism protein [Thermoanaerobaculia bacterium]|nr:CADD family putative folate metabolism protein [Thermoanaerobaculia bacterium]
MNEQALERRIASRHLLDHPFYQRWNAGELTPEELSEYARQYWHYTLAFPTFVSGIHANSNDMVVRQALLENLIEEERGSENHPELWLRFCEALGLSRDEVVGSTASDSTRHLIDTMRSLTRDGSTHQGLAALHAYESQVPAVSRSKIEGLARWYEMTDERAISFFSVHEEADVYHSRTSRELIDRLCDDPSKCQEAEEATQKTLDALYVFLDGVTVN